MKDAPRLSGRTACRPSEPPTGGRAGRFGAAVRGGLWMKDAPRLSGRTACRPAEPPAGGAPYGLAEPDPWGPGLAGSAACCAFMPQGWRTAARETDT